MEAKMNQLIEIAQQLQSSGLTAGWLLLIGGLFAITLMVSIRELASWYFKVNQVQEQMDGIEKTLMRLEKKIEGLQSETSFNDGSLIHKAKLAPVDENRFTSKPLNH